MKDIGLNIVAFDFSIDYGAIGVKDILEIHQYLMKKT